LIEGSESNKPLLVARQTVVAWFYREFSQPLRRLNQIGRASSSSTGGGSLEKCSFVAFCQALNKGLQNRVCERVARRLESRALDLFITSRAAAIRGPRLAALQFAGRQRDRPPDD
jgi:hypothetical protein